MEKIIDKIINGDMFAKSAGIELLEVTEGHSVARMRVTPNHLNSEGVCQGGALFTLADLAFAAASNSRGILTLSLNANITYLRSVSSGYIFAEATELLNHHRVPFIEVRLTDDVGELVAVFTSSGYRKNHVTNGYGEGTRK